MGSLINDPDKGHSHGSEAEWAERVCDNLSVKMPGKV